MTKPILIKAGDPILKLGQLQQPPRVDCRVVAEEEYQNMLNLLERSKKLIENLRSISKESENYLNDYDNWLNS